MGRGRPQCATAIAPRQGNQEAPRQPAPSLGNPWSPRKAGLPERRGPTRLPPLGLAPPYDSPRPLSPAGGGHHPQSKHGQPEEEDIKAAGPIRREQTRGSRGRGIPRGCGEGARDDFRPLPPLSSYLSLLDRVAPSSSLNSLPAKAYNGARTPQINYVYKHPP